MKRLWRRLFRSKKIYYVKQPECVRLLFDRALQYYDPGNPDRNLMSYIAPHEVTDGYIPGFYMVSVHLQRACWVQ